MDRRNKENKIRQWLSRSFKTINEKLKSFCKVFLPPLIILAILLFVGFQVYPELAASIVSFLSSGKMIPVEKQSSSSQPPIITYTLEERSSVCDSNFKNDNKWKIDKYWEQDKNNPQRFTAQPKRKLGGPKMRYYETVSDNFHLILDFKPIANETVKGDEINLILYVGDLYRLVLGDGDRDTFYLKQENRFVSELTTNLDQSIPLPNRIRLNKWVTLEIDQHVPSNSTNRTITVSFFYTPDEVENAQSISKSYVFQIDEDSPPDKVSRQISIGLLYGKNTIITEFYCFKLEKK